MSPDVPSQSGSDSLPGVARLALSQLDSVARQLEEPGLQEKLLEMGRRDASSWELIGAAKEIVEASCRAVLKDAGIANPPHSFVPLVKETRRQFEIAPVFLEGAEEAAKHLDDLLNGVVAGLGKLRNLKGRGHGVVIHDQVQVQLGGRLQTAWL